MIDVVGNHAPNRTAFAIPPTNHELIDYGYEQKT